MRMDDRNPFKPGDKVIVDTNHLYLGIANLTVGEHTIESVDDDYVTLKDDPKGRCFYKFWRFVHANVIAL